MSVQDGIGNDINRIATHQENLRGKNELTNQIEDGARKRRALASISENLDTRGDGGRTRKRIILNVSAECEQNDEIELCSQPTYWKPLYASDSVLSDLPGDKPVEYYSQLVQLATNSSALSAVMTNTDLSILFQKEKERKNHDSGSTEQLEEDPSRGEKLPERSSRLSSMDIQRDRTLVKPPTHIAMDLPFLKRRREWEDGADTTSSFNTPPLRANNSETLESHSFLHFGDDIPSLDIPRYARYSDEEYYSISLYPEYMSSMGNPIDLLLSALT